ncbi:MAG TPA: thiolase family protein, partial [Candidatus Binatia bacterium]|nr:thiolase family protein [Candidatus Binatia bacterium]
LISDGGAAYIMTSLERARDLRQPIVAVLGVGVGNSRAGGHSTSGSGNSACISASPRQRLAKTSVLACGPV